jgi:hypothetical protein
MHPSSFPHRIALDPDEYHASGVGHTTDGRQVIATAPFVPATRTEAGREFHAIYLFDREGRLVDALIDDLGPRAELNFEQARELRARRLSTLGPITPQRIEVWPFEVERFGIQFGLIPRPPDEPEGGVDEFDGWWVEAQPGNYMAFHAPWNSGEYDT